MSSNLIRRIVIALGVLVVLWLVLRVVRDVARQEGATLSPPMIDRTAVDAIAIERPDDTIRLVRTAAAWTVNGLAASPTAVVELLDAVTDTAAAAELVAENPTSHEQLGLDSAQARRVAVLSGSETLLDYLVGKRGANFESAYLRRPGRNNVFQVRGRLVELVERAVNDWRDRAILELEPDSLAAIEVEWKGGSYTLTRRDSVWLLRDSLPTDAAAVGRLVSQFRRLETSGFATETEADSADFAFPDRRVRLLDRQRRALATLVFDSTASGFWVRRDTMPTVFRLDSWVANQVTPPDSGLLRRDTTATR